MTNNEVALRTRRKKARYGTKVEIAGQPADGCKVWEKRGFYNSGRDSRGSLWQARRSYCIQRSSELLKM